MKTSIQIQEDINNLQEQLKEAKAKEKAEEQKNKNKLTFTYIEELDLEISQLAYKDMTYSEILKIVDEEDIATHEELFSLRKLVDKYPQFKDFWAFVPNPDDVAKKNGYVARFYANSDGVGLCTNYNSDYSNSTLGVFVVKRKVKNVK